MTDSELRQLECEQHSVCKRAIETYGNKAQTVVAMEELAELIKELSKHFRGKGNLDHIAKEVADVEIMLTQIKLMFPHADELVCIWKKKKLARLKEGMEEER